MLSLTANVISRELQQRGFQITELSPSLVLVQKEGKHCLFHDSILPSQNGVGVRVCNDKYLSKLICDVNNIPTAKWMKISRVLIPDTVSLRFPVVVKPLGQYGGKDVVVGVDSIEGIKKYIADHLAYDDIIIEETLTGQDIRLLLVGGRFFAAVTREPASVTGNGTATIQELIDGENQKREMLLEKQRATGEFVYDIEKIKDDDEVDICLKNQGKQRDSVPPADQKVFVRRNANVSTGGISIDITDSVCEETKKLCEQIGNAFGMSILGIDVMTTDISKPLNIEQGSGIVEVNASPGLGLHMFPRFGTARNPVPLFVNEIEEYFNKS